MRLTARLRVGADSPILMGGSPSKVKVKKERVKEGK